MDNTPNQVFKFRTRNRVEVNDATRWIHNTNSQIKFKNSMLMSSFCDCTDAYILVEGTITVPNTRIAAAQNSREKKVIFKNRAPFLDWISEINNTQVGNTKYTDVEIPMYNLIEYNNSYLKTIGIL